MWDYPLDVVMTEAREEGGGHRKLGERGPRSRQRAGVGVEGEG